MLQQINKINVLNTFSNKSYSCAVISACPFYFFSLMRLLSKLLSIATFYMVIQINDVKYSTIHFKFCLFRSLHRCRRSLYMMVVYTFHVCQNKLSYFFFFQKNFTIEMAEHDTHEIIVNNEKSTNCFFSLLNE